MIELFFLLHAQGFTDGVERNVSFLSPPPPPRSYLSPSPSLLGHSHLSSPPLSHFLSPPTQFARAGKNFQISLSPSGKLSVGYVQLDSHKRLAARSATTARRTRPIQRPPYLCGQETKKGRKDAPSLSLGWRGRSILVCPPAPPSCIVNFSRPIPISATLRFPQDF